MPGEDENLDTTFDDEETEDDFEADLERLGESADETPPPLEEEPPRAAAPEEGPEGEEPQDARTEEEKRRDAEMAQMRRRQERAESRLQQVLNAIYAGAADDEEAEALATLPDFEDDPKGYVDGLMALQSAKEEIAQESDQRRQIAEELEGQREEVERFLVEDRAAFLKEHPDFPAAESFLAKLVVEELMFQDPRLDEEAADMIFRTQVLAPMYARYGTTRKSLAEAVYKKALARGWKPNETSRVRRLERRQRGARSLSTVTPGGRQQKIPEASAVNEMSDDEFSDFLDEIGEKQFRQIAKEYSSEL